MNEMSLFVRCCGSILACFFVISASEADHDVDAKVRQWVEKLASTNRAPPERDGTRESFLQHWPAEYEFAAQQQVYDAGDKILAMGAAAIPELLRHLKDERYSVTERSGTGATHNRTVGHECNRLFGLQVKAGVAPLWEGRGNPASFHDPVGWWRDNQDRPLWEIQLKFVEKELADYREIVKKPKRDFQPDLKKYIRGLEANEAKLKETHEPLAVKYPRNRMLNRRGD